MLCSLQVSLVLPEPRLLQNFRHFHVIRRQLSSNEIRLELVDRISELEVFSRQEHLHRPQLLGLIDQAAEIGQKCLELTLARISESKLI